MRSNCCCCKAAGNKVTIPPNDDFIKGGGCLSLLHRWYIVLETHQFLCRTQTSFHEATFPLKNYTWALNLPHNWDMVICADFVLNWNWPVLEPTFSKKKKKWKIQFWSCFDTQKNFTDSCREISLTAETSAEEMLLVFESVWLTSSGGHWSRQLSIYSKTLYCIYEYKEYLYIYIYTLHYIWLKT